MLKKGPELKLPEIKVPGFLLDVYYDLRERHLLPLVAILLVAVVALPITLSGGSSESESPEAAIATPSAAVPTSGLVVAKAAPGLRDYRRRLEDRAPRDPFVQQYTGEGSGDAAAAGDDTSGDASSSVESAAAPSEPASPNQAVRPSRRARSPSARTATQRPIGCFSTTPSRSTYVSCRSPNPAKARPNPPSAAISRS